MVKRTDTYSYKGWLISDKFYKRFLAIMGYGVLAWITVYLSILGLLLLAVSF